MRAEAFTKIFPQHAGRTMVKGPMIAADHLAYLLDKPICDVCKKGDLLAAGLLKAQKLYNSDFIIVFSDVSVEAEAMGVTLQYPSHLNPYPTAHLNLKQITPVDITSSGRVPELLSAAWQCRRALNPDFTIFYSMKDPFSLAGMLIGAERFLEMLLLAPLKADDLLNICTEVQINYLKTIISNGYIPLIGAPLASGSLIGQSNFARFVTPNLLKLLDETTERGSYRCLHLCGKIGMLASELVELKLNLLSFEDFHDSMWNEMPGTIAMGFVPTDLFLKGNQEKLRASVRFCQQVLPFPFVLSSGCDLPAKADPELVKVMMGTQLD